MSKSRQNRFQKMKERRPDPDALLDSIQTESKGKGRLKVFLGAAPGVGKTYSMLSEATEQLDRGVDVVIGYIETHGRKETEALIGNIESIPLKEIQYKGILAYEPYYEKIIERHPEIVLVDELPHSNPEGSRHKKRWQDILELLNAGISVYTAINIQHLESLNDVVAQITGVKVQETVPDAFFENAAEIELVDIPASDLQQRLRDGKIYVPEKVELSLSGFFKASNLTALRELALRRAADSVDIEMRRLRTQAGAEGPWATRDRVLVCVAPNRMACRVVRAAARVGLASKAELIAVTVDSDRQAGRQAADRDEAAKALDLAKGLGMEIVNLAGHDIVAEVFGLARRRNANLVVVGKPIRPRWKELLYGSVVDAMVRASGDIDVYVITGEAPEAGQKSARELLKSEPVSALGLAMSVGPAIAATALGMAMFGEFGIANVAMIYVLAVAVFSVRSTRIESALASLLGVLAFDFVFVEPRFSFAISDSRYLLLFAVMLSVALVISTLTHRLKEQLAASSKRERRTSSLYRLSQQLAQHRGKMELAHAALTEIQSVFEGDGAIFIKNANSVEVLAGSQSKFENDPHEAAVANWVVDHGLPAGNGTDTLPAAKAIYIPLRGVGTVVGVLAFQSNREVDTIDSMQLLETFSNALGVALERAILAKESNEAKLFAESERLRSTLLQSISHDLRTPLTSIIGAATKLKEGSPKSDELADSIYQESIRLNRQIQNLLDMTKLKSGSIDLNLQWHSPSELVATAVEQIKNIAETFHIQLNVPPNLVLLKVDGLLIEKALINLLENAVRHGGPKPQIIVRVWIADHRMNFSVSDEGPGFVTKPGEDIFEAKSKLRQDGFGLGLPIVKSIAELHGGEATAHLNSEKGSTFTLSIPLPKSQPEVPDEQD